MGDVGLNKRLARRVGAIRTVDRRLVARLLVAIGMGLVVAAAAVAFGLAAALLVGGVLCGAFGLLFVDVPEGRR